jgi:hypothetical protein
MGWNDCFDFDKLEFTKPDTKTTEIYRVLRDGGRFVCCSWEAQEDLAWMEEAMLRYYPEILRDCDYLERRPIGVAYEKPAGYNIILRSAGFRDIEIIRETAEFVSTNEEEWWRQMQAIGWDIIIEKIKLNSADQYQRMKEGIFNDLQGYKQEDGIHFTKAAFYVIGEK